MRNVERDAKGRTPEDLVRLRATARLIREASFKEGGMLPKPPPKYRPKAPVYTLGESEHDTPRYPDDPICCGTRWRVLADGVEVGSVFKSPAYGMRFTFNLNPLRWMGKRNETTYHDPMWHDGGPCDTREKALAEFVRRAEHIRKWRIVNQ